MDIKKLETMNENELEELDSNAQLQIQSMLTNLNMLDERAAKLDRENVMKDLELKDLRTSIRMGNKNLRVLESEIRMITKYLWILRKGRQL